MEINLYGVASINLDKVGADQIKRYMYKLVLCYIVVLALSTILPPRVVKTQLGYSELDGEVLRFRQDFTLDDPNLQSFEIIISDFKAISLKENITQKSMENESYAKNHIIDLSIRWYETDE
jgi:hypothetical protein